MSVERDDLKMQTAEHGLKVRVTGVIFDDQHRVLTVTDGEAFSLIGGKQKFGELSQEAIVREFMEETGMTVRPARLLAVIENLFEVEGKSWQEIGFMYLIGAVGERRLDELAVMADDQDFRWLPESQWGELLPHGIDKIISELPENPVHLVVKN
ncbi:NUDIX domain-containing protein [Lapidilactobacillus mulanensis]|uniref:NUDIX domain-containing protein n=1 Tax=Lapidilactobacillus mulanensis TaxID=2485999 RepID=A0ABW4DL46_9LACO|nr:NUDIX domain-containing protein [Lapidilactobacillus mulanensis]